MQRAETKLAYVTSMMVILLARVSGIRAALETEIDSEHHAHLALDQLEQDLMAIQEHLAESSAAEDKANHSDGGAA